MTSPATSRISARLAFRLSLAAGLVILVLTVLSALREPVQACGGLDPNYAPIIAFELARAETDLQAIFGAPDNPCRPGMIAAMDTINWIDVLAFIPVYGAFLVFFFLGLAYRNPKLARLGLQISIVAVLGDYAENTCLMNLTPALDASSVWLQLLPWATGVKWLGLGAAAAVAAMIFAHAPDRRPWHIVAALACFVSVLVSMAAMFAPVAFGPLLSAGIGISWLVFLIDDAIEVIAGPGQPTTT